ncbi:hypothetical protein ACJ73_10057 [Blastomyces percursus]|uniref:Uncharacterized protein n=1 Tax=Blastomyces percursus TaxID=1658174 RepID=A0A1J9NZ32_9EURO|nr:hypothetical protein ACJ73_10057 [Blastomyces percursus]
MWPDEFVMIDTSDECIVEMRMINISTIYALRTPTPEVAPVVKATKKEDEPAVTMDTAIDSDAVVAEAEVASATSASSTITDAEDAVVTETVAPGTAR